MSHRGTPSPSTHNRTRRDPSPSTIADNSRAINAVNDSPSLSLPPPCNNMAHPRASLTEDLHSISGRHETAASGFGDTRHGQLPPLPTPGADSSVTLPPNLHINNSVTPATIPLASRPRHPTPTGTNSQLSCHFGDPWPRPKHHRHLRLSFSNINGFDTEVYDNHTVQHLRQWLQETSTDIFLGCEANINWAKMPWDGQLSSWFRSGEALRTVTGYNIHEETTSDRRQFGGTFGLAFGPSASRIVSTGQDTTGLGRWSWFRLSGRDNTFIRIVVAYRPVKQPRSHLLSTYMQHSRFFTTHRDFTCPRRAFYRDLKVDLTSWSTLGDQIILAGDFNDPVDQPHLIQFFAAFNMRNLLSDHHQRGPSSTHNRGSTVIDAIWASSSLQMAAGTWLSFDMSIADHRSIVIDFDDHLLLGAPLAIVRPHGRRLNSRLPLVRQIYIRLLEQFLQRAHLPLKAKVLCNTDWSLHPPSSLHQHLETMDSIRCEGMQFAEARCRRFHTGVVFFSPMVNNARNHRDLYRLLIRKLSGAKVSRSRITKLAKKCGVADACRISLLEARRRFSHADAHYRSLKPRSAALREDFLRHKLSDPSTSPDTQSALRRLLQREAQRTTFRILNSIAGKSIGSSVGDVQENVGSPDNPIILTHSDRRSVESALTSTLSSRFCLTHATPLLHPLSVARFGLLGWTPDAQAVLSGDFDYDSLPVSEPTKMFLRGLRSSTVPSISTDISAQNFIDYWRRAREDTSSSYSGLHFGHYKAAVHSPFLSDMHALLTETSFRAGYPLLRWRRGLQVILEKTPGLRLVNKLRAILLLEADFNFGNKLYVGSRMMRNVLQNEHQALPPELYGGVKGKRADLMALTRRLLLDIVRQKRRTAAIASVDAESCYDRIAHTAASLACQRWGVPGPIMTTMLIAIQQMQFHLRTAFGDSVIPYGSDSHTTFQGICQGNGAGPAVWLAISASIVKTLSDTYPCTPLLAPISKASLSLSGLLFVDDTDILFVGPPGHTHHTEVITALQRRVDLWTGLLHASGGAISLEKSSWSLISFLPTTTDPTFHTSYSAPGYLTLPDPCNPSSSPRRIKRLAPWESSKVVGVMQAPNGTMKGQLRELRRLADSWSTILARSNLPRHLMWVALRSKIWAALRYPLLCTTITKQEGHALVSRLYQQVLPKLGATRSLPNAFKYGPARSQGLGLPHPYYYQGGQQVSTFVHLLLTDSLEGKALRLSWEQLQLQLGTDTPFTSLSFSAWGTLATPCWLTSLWQFISDNEICIEGMPRLYPHIPRINDDFLMPILVRHRTPTSTLRSFNRVRMGLHILTLSDLSTGDGRQVHHGFLSPHHLPVLPSNFEWPPSPFSTQDARTWVHTLRLLFPSTLFPLRLGSWIFPPPRPYWTWWIDPESSCVYRFQPPSYWICFQRRPGTRTRNSTYHLFSVRPGHLGPPEDLHRTTVIEVNDTTVIPEGSAPHWASSPHSPTAPDPMSCSSMAEYISLLPSNDYWPLRSSCFPEDGHAIINALAHGTAVGVCDGSYMPKLDRSRAAAAWTIVDSAHPTLTPCSGSTMVSGDLLAINAYRAELQGIHAILLALSSLCSFHHVLSGSLHLYCDNLRAVALASLPVVALRSQLSHLDLLRAITRLRASLPISISISHVAGHQDDTSSILWESLPLEAQLNVRCDHRAKQFLLESIRLQRPPPPATLHSEGLSVLLHGRKVFHRLLESVTDHAGEVAFRSYILSKNSLSMDSYDRVNWTANGTAFTNMSNPFRLWAVKFISGFSGTAVQMHRWGQWASPLCPCCRLHLETTAHLLTCPATSIVQARQTGLSQLSAWLLAWDTHPVLLDMIQALCSAEPQCPPSALSASDPLLPLAFASQLSLGTTNFWYGRHICLLEAIQSTHYHSTSSPRSGHAWAAGLISTCLTILHNIWLARNDIVHSHSLQGLSHMESEQLSTDIREQFTMGLASLLPADRHLLTSRPLNNILALPAAHKRTWLSSIRLAREIGLEANQSDLHHMSTLMHQWLGR